MRGARIGDKINLEGHSPPWIEVYIDKASINIIDRSGRLLQVCILKAATELDQHALSSLSADYIRCVTVYVENVVNEDFWLPL